MIDDILDCIYGVDREERVVESLRKEYQNTFAGLWYSSHSIFSLPLTGPPPAIRTVHSPHAATQTLLLDGIETVVHDQYLGQVLNRLTFFAEEYTIGTQAMGYLSRLAAQRLYLRNLNREATVLLLISLTSNERSARSTDPQSYIARGRLTALQERFVLAHEIGHAVLASYADGLSRIRDDFWRSFCNLLSDHVANGDLTPEERSQFAGALETQATLESGHLRREVVCDAVAFFSVLAISGRSCSWPEMVKGCRLAIANLRTLHILDDLVLFFTGVKDDLIEKRILEHSLRMVALQHLANMQTGVWDDDEPESGKRNPMNTAAFGFPTGKVFALRNVLKDAIYKCRDIAEIVALAGDRDYLAWRLGFVKIDDEKFSKEATRVEAWIQPTVQRLSGTINADE